MDMNVKSRVIPSTTSSDAGNDDVSSSGETTSGATRRSFLGLVLGGAAAAVGLGAQDASAATGGNMLLGMSNTAGATTLVTTTGGTAMAAVGPIGLSGKTSAKTTTASGVQGVAAGTANYGVFSNGKTGCTGPLEMATLTVTNWPNPATSKAYLYVKTNVKVTELRFKVGTNDVLITSG